MNASPASPAVGDHAPLFRGVTLAGRAFRLEAAAGQPQLLVFLGALDRSAGALLRALEAAFAGAGVGLLAATDADGDAARAFVAACGTAAEIAPQAGAIARLYTAEAARPLVLVLDPNLRVLDRIEAADPIVAVAAVGGALSRIAAAAAIDVACQAPVLLVPEVLSPALCRGLIRAFDEGAQEPSGSMKEAEGGRVVEVLDPAFKIRSDVLLTKAHPLYAEVRDGIGRRVLPEIRKAFHCDARRIERFLVARYDAATGGYFRRHRDNTTPATAHRRFAMTLNLNAEAHEGGHLRFPEYAPHRYRPPTGHAIIFSGSLLHEATDVTRGVRYALLSFFHTDADEALREAYRRRHGSEFEVIRR